MLYQQLFRTSRQFSGTRSALHWWRNAYGTELPPRGFVWITHGIGEHGARYREVAQFLTQFGFDVVSLDLPGHGLSAKEGGQKELVSVQEMVEELDEARSYWLHEGPLASRGIGHQPFYLFGHSMGALLTLAWILNSKRSGVASEFATRAYVSAPPLKLRLPVPEWKNLLARKLVDLRPGLRIPHGIQVEDLSYDAVNRENYRTDPLVHGDATPGLYLSMLATAEEILQRARDIEIPLCIAVGADDPIVEPKTLENYYGALGTHKKFFLFQNKKHEIFNEIGRDECYKTLVEWIC